MALQQRPLNFTDVFSIFILDQRVRGNTARTVETYDERLGRFFAFLDDAGVKIVDQVTPTHIRTYLLSMQERGLSSYTVHGAARAIRAFFQFCRPGRTLGGLAHG